MIARLGRDLAAGGTLPADLPALAQKSLAHVEQMRVADLAIAHLRDDVARRWRAEIREHADEMLTGLAAVLEVILQEVRAAAAVVGELDLTDPEAVGEASTKQRKALAELKALRPRYRNLRYLQENLLANTAEMPPAGSGLQSWRLLFKTRVHEFSATGTHGAPATDLPSVLWFRRLLDRDDAWLPTLTELTDAVAAPPRRSAPHADTDPARQDEIRRREAATRTTVGLLSLNR